MYVLIVEEYMLTKKDRNVFNKSTSDVNEQGHCKPSLKRVTRNQQIYSTQQGIVLYVRFQFEDGKRLYVWKPKHFLNQSLIAVNPG